MFRAISHERHFAYQFSSSLCHLNQIWHRSRTSLLWWLTLRQAVVAYCAAWVTKEATRFRPSLLQKFDISSFSVGHEEQLCYCTVIYTPTNFGHGWWVWQFYAGMPGRRLV